MTLPPLLLSRLREPRPELAAMRTTMRPISPMSKMPWSTPISRMLSRMSPLRMWLNSCATTPCNSSRESCSAVPRVTATTASLGE
jgi:hypothetical protein